MVEKIVTIKNKTGLHARPASLFASKANSFGCNVFVEKDGKKSNAKSIISIMAIGASQGTSIKIITDGVDELKAADDLVELLESFKD